jgi:3-hydroxyacyl-CoA dehydrogenase
MTLALDNVRRLLEWSRQDHCDGLASAASSPIENVGILGAGMMGRAIAAAHVAHQLPVVVSDSNHAVLTGAVASIAAELPAPIRAQIQDMSGLLRATADAREAARCDLVLESIVESLPTKQRLFAELQAHLARHAIVASNTSTIPIGRLAESFADASRFCGMHFFHPVRHRPLVEIVRGPRTSDRTIAAAVTHVRRIGKIPIVARDGPGFLVNRLLFPYLGEALELLRAGVCAETIERAAAEFGMAIGPLRLMDEIGLDTTLQAGWVLAAAFPERIVASPLLVSLVKAGRLGRKAGAGFYVYHASSPQLAADTAVEEITARWIDGRHRPFQESIALRLVLPMLLEATRILDEGQGYDARTIDVAVLFGLGFPADKGGLLWWADALGPDRILAMLRSHGTMEDRNRPTPMLLALANSGGRFHPKSIAATAVVSQMPRIPAAEAVPW